MYFGIDVLTEQVQGLVPHWIYMHPHESILRHLPLYYVLIVLR